MVHRRFGAAVAIGMLAALAGCGAPEPSVEAADGSPPPVSSPSPAAGRATSSALFQRLSCDGMSTTLISDGPPDRSNQGLTPEEVLEATLAKGRAPAWIRVSGLTWQRRDVRQPGIDPEATTAQRRARKAHLPAIAAFVGTRPDGKEQAAVWLERYSPHDIWDPYEYETCGEAPRFAP